MSSSQKLLQAYKLRLTPWREQVIDLFLAHDYALSKQEIEKRFMPLADRVTLYRTIKTLLGAGLIHPVPDESGQLKYALSDSENETKTAANKMPHAHFKCSICSHTICLENITIPAIELPQGFELQSYNHLITGICKQCNVSQKTTTLPQL